MKIEPFQMERMQSTWENVVEYDLSESGVLPLTLRDLTEMGLEAEALMDVPLGYSQTNGTPELRELLAHSYPGATLDSIEVTNGSSEANFVAALTALDAGDGFGLEMPNYMQLWGLPRALGADVRTFRLRYEQGWEPDWDEFEQAVRPGTRAVYVSHPNNPTGKVLSEAAMRRIVEHCGAAGAMLIADEVYLGSEIRCERATNFWGMGDNVVVTSGLSKAYGIPGLRIGWIVGPEDFVRQCWTHHDYITIGPNKLSDIIARVALAPENREKCYARTRALLQENVAVVREWADGLDGLLTFREPEAGAIALLKYDGPVPSTEICEQIRQNQDTLIVPGAHFGLEGFLRVWMGAPPERLREGLARVETELRRIL
jgi:aspartate/methionine/tyrosine aminotransferase